MLEKLRKDGIDSAIIMISGHGDIETAVECIKKGAFDFIQKPLDLNRILITIKNATERTQIITENTNLKKKVFGQQMIGESAPIKHLKEMIEKVAPTDARVLITGPNGSGKELVARSLHQQSNRSAMPYIEVNCAAIRQNSSKVNFSDMKRAPSHLQSNSIKENSNRPTAVHCSWMK